MSISIGGRAIRRGAGVAIAALWLAALAPVSAAAHGDEAHPIRIVNGHWLEAGRFVRREFFSVEGTLRAQWSGAVDDTLDLAGGFVVPPYADAHNHLLADTSSFEAEQRRFLRAGVFYVANPNNPGSRVAGARARAGRPRGVEVIYSNGGLTSAGGHPAQIYDPDPAAVRWAGDAYVEVDDEVGLERAWPQLLAGRPDFIKVYLESSEHHAARRTDPAYRGRRGLDPALVPRVVALAARAGRRVSCHVTSAADFHVAVTAGVQEISHLPLAPIDEADAREAARRGIVVVTTVVSHRPFEGKGDPDSIHAGNLRRLRQAGVRMTLGTDHPALTVLDEVDRLRRLGVLDDPTLFTMLTHDTPRAVFPGRRIGQLEPGAEASFLVLEGDPLADLAHLKRIRLRVKRGVLVEVPAEKPSVAEAMVPLLMRGDVDGAIALYDRLRRDEPDRHDFGEQALNQIGYRLLQHGQAAAALRIFRKNAELFPGSANAFDSLADGLLATGDSSAAATAYRQVLTALAEQRGGNEAQRRNLEKRAHEQLAKLKAREP